MLTDSGGCATRSEVNSDLFAQTVLAESPESAPLLGHANKYRNTLIHEFREPGKYAIPSVDDLSPFSKAVEHESTGEKTWELVFPVKFLERLCERSIDGLEKYLIENNQDPYESYERGPLWSRS